MLLLHRVRTFARSRSDFSTNRSTRSHRVETFNRAPPESREGGKNRGGNTPLLHLLLSPTLTRGTIKNPPAEEIVPPDNFFHESSLESRFQKGGKSEPKKTTPSVHLEKKKKKKRNYELKVDR